MDIFSVVTAAGKAKVENAVVVNVAKRDRSWLVAETHRPIEGRKTTFAVAEPHGHDSAEQVLGEHLELPVTVEVRKHDLTRIRPDCDRRAGHKQGGLCVTLDRKSTRLNSSHGSISY